jgi:ATP-dependent exoDNAse (exonuclease V) beta subunit
MTTDRLIFRIYNETDMLAVMGALHDGEARRGNLMKLVSLAARYEANGLKGLGSFMGSSAASSKTATSRLRTPACRPATR